MNEIEWVDEPPPDSRTRTADDHRKRVVELLKQNPGKWALVETDVQGARAANYRNRGCEAVSRRRPEQKGTKLSDIYARWPVEDEGSA